MRLLVALSMAIASALSVSPARAGVYTFAASCSDCSGPSGTALVTATLILAGETPGLPSDVSNFVSFSYGGSDRAPAFTILPGGAYPLSFSALFLDQATQYADVHIRGIEDGGPGGWDFTTAADGSFNLALFGTGIAGGGGGVDQGTDATWTNAAATVPEAPSLTVIGVGLVAAVAANRRRSGRKR